jgi:hypothetical protein
MPLQSRPALVTLALWLVACPAPPTPSRPDVDPWARAAGRHDPPSSGRTLTYVFSSLAIDPSPQSERVSVAGFNLDGLYSVAFHPRLGDTPNSCAKPDQPSRTDLDSNCPREFWIESTGRCLSRGCNDRDPTCFGGVDNQLPSIAQLFEQLSPTHPQRREVVARAFALGHAAFIVQLRGVDSFDHDEDVRVSISRAVPLSPPPCNASIALRAYALASLRAGGADTREGFATIRGGRLRATIEGTVQLPLFGMRTPLWDWALDGVRFAVDLREEGGTNGNLGATTSYEPLAQLVAAENQLWFSIIAGLSDIEVSSRCQQSTETSIVRNRIAIGLRFNWTRAVLEPREADEPPPGACPVDPLVPALPDAATDANDAANDAATDANDAASDAATNTNDAASDAPDQGPR